MILAININTVDGHGLNNKVCHELLPKNTSTAVLAVRFIVRAFYQLYNTKWACHVGSKAFKKDWPIVLQ